MAFAYVCRPFGLMCRSHGPLKPRSSWFSDREGHHDSLIEVEVGGGDVEVEGGLNLHKLTMQENHSDGSTVVERGRVVGFSLVEDEAVSAVKRVELSAGVEGVFQLEESPTRIEVGPDTDGSLPFSVATGSGEGPERTYPQGA